MRPTKYKKAFNADVVELGRAGKSRAQIATALGVHRATLHRWSRDHVELCDALDQADDLAQAYWEDVLDQATMGLLPGVNARLLELTLRNRFTDWNTSHKVEKTIDATLTIDAVTSLREKLGAMAGPQLIEHAATDGETIDIQPLHRLKDITNT